MRKNFFISCLPLFLCGVLLTGAVGFNAPVMPTKNFYINDYAQVIEEETRDGMLKLAKELDGEKGIREVVLTVESFGGRSPEEYAASVFDSWEIGAGGKTGILVLLCTEEKRIIMLSNKGISTTYSMEMAEKLAAAGKFNEAVSAYFFAVADSVRQSGEAAGNTHEAESADTEAKNPAHEIQDAKPAENAQETEYAYEEKESGDRYYIVALGLFLLVALRAVRVSMRYRKKYNNNSAYYRENFQKRYDYSRTARHDDGDYPSGFGGLGNRKAIYGEQVDEAEDVGIIKHDYEDIFDGDNRSN